MKRIQPIVITGFMGCGKTTIGRLLAERLGVAFYDLDQLIEAAAARTPRKALLRVCPR